MAVIYRLLVPFVIALRKSKSRPCTCLENI